MKKRDAKALTKLDLKKCVEIIKEILPPDMPVAVYTEFKWRIPGTLLVMVSRGNWFVPVIADGDGCDYADVRSGAGDLVRQEAKEPRPENPTPQMFSMAIEELELPGARMLYRRYKGVEWDAWGGTTRVKAAERCCCECGELSHEKKA